MTRPTGRAARRAPRTECAADCIADSAGGITFDITGPARPDAALVLRRRDDDPADPADPAGPAISSAAASTASARLAVSADEMRLPLTCTGGPWVRAVLPSTVELAEGHWDVRTGVRGERPVRSGALDVRAPAGRSPGTGGVAARIPYPTADGRLAVRSWLRAPHAEARSVRCAPGTVTVEGTLYGAELGRGAVVEARLRGGDRVSGVAVTGAGGAFVFTLPYGSLDGGPAVDRQWWDLWLRPAQDAAGIRIARILDDIWDKRALAHPVHGGGGRRATPCYTGDNDLSVRIDPLDRLDPVPVTVPGPALLRWLARSDAPV
ncbi:hypothetical protein [Streptomyces sp. NPDC088725]|uniref:hypothetical protein n=1 Tax=Streptomyces sp. NPDC088725 TaxID=3365873 RepID=UPI00382075ED